MPVTTNQISISFFGRIPSKKNGRRWLKRGAKKFSVPSLAYESWEKCEVARLKALHHSPKLANFHITITPYFATNGVRDLDNLETSIMDCLKSAGIIKDDRWQCMSAPTTKIQPKIDRDNPRVEVVIKF